MAQQITKKTRHVQKHDIEANWEKATGFAPIEGEIIVYTPDDTHDFPRIKIGHNNTNVNALPFINEPLIVEFDGQSQISHTSQEIDAYVRAGKQVYVYSPALGDTVFTLVSSNPDVVFFTSAIADDLNVQRLEVYNDQAYYYDNYLATGDQFNDWLITKHVEIIPDNLDNSSGVVLLSEDPVEQYDDDNNSPVEVLTFYGSGGDEAVRLRHLAPGVNDDDAATISQIVQSDWDITDESDPAAIKNKPFGMIEQMVDIVPEAEYGFYKPIDTTTDIVCFATPDFNEDAIHCVWFNDIYLGTAKPNDMIAIPNGQFYFTSRAMVIQGGNYPEGIYKIRIVEKQVIAKKLDSQWLNIQDDIYGGDMTDPVNGHAVVVAVSNFGQVVSMLNGRIDAQVMPAIGPIPTEADEGKFLQIVNQQPTWVAIANGNEVAY